MTTTSELETLLVERLSVSYFRTAEAGRTQSFDLSTASLSSFRAIGLDTNILKAFRSESRVATSLVQLLADAGVALIVPGQCVIEFWNNHKVFANNDWANVKGQMGGVQKAIEKMGAISVAETRIAQIETIIDEVMKDLQESTAPDFLQTSQFVMDTILETAIQPMVARDVFHRLAVARQQGKIPPGFADDKEKGLAGLGDFYGWCDFLFGVLSLEPGDEPHEYLFVTDEKKPDWRAGNSAHPQLIHEFERVTGGNLAIAGLSELRTLVRLAQEAKALKAEQQDP